MTPMWKLMTAVAVGAVAAGFGAFDLEGCRGPFTLESGTGKFSGIAGEGEMIRVFRRDN